MPDTHTQELILIKTRRLQVLERREAHEGIHAPPEVVNEIAQLRQEIRRLSVWAHSNVVRTLRLESERPARFPGLLALVSPVRPDQDIRDQAAFAAIDYHRPTLRYCWLIASGGEHGSLSAAYALQEFCQQREITAYVWQIADALNVSETANLVDWLYTYDVPANQLNDQQVIADITGATKPMSFGVLLVCRSRRAVQYMAYQPQGPSQPLLLQLELPDEPPRMPTSNI